MFRNSLSMRKLSVRDMCFMAMLVAITIILSVVSGYLRIGDSIKFSISFISVYVGAALFGPVAGGVIAAMADVISYVMNPTGAFIPVFTLMEFVNGLLFGLFLYRTTPEKRSLVRVVLLATLCAALQFGVNMFWRTYELSRLYLSPFWPKFIERLPGNVVMVVCKVVVIILLEPYIGSFMKVISKTKE